MKAKAICGMFRRRGAWSAGLMVLTLALLAPVSSRAQWQTQTIQVPPGWSAMYLHVDASYTNLDFLAGDPANPIDEIWLWRGDLDVVKDPETPASSSVDWVYWSRTNLNLQASSLSSLIPNAAYLVHSKAATNYVWNLKGKPVPPQYTWKTSGLNFLGFPTRATAAPSFHDFLTLGGLRSAASIYYYPSNSSQLNPVPMLDSVNTRVRRGQAFWVNTGSLYNDYYGPFALDLSIAREVGFGDAQGQYSLRLRNRTITNVTVSLRLLPSEAPPYGQTPVVDIVPLLVRGELSMTNLAYGYSTLTANGVQTWTLPPAGQSGSDIQVVLGVNRYALTNGPGSFYAGILEFTDSLGMSQIDVPVSALAGSTAGLWVGNASVSQVASYLPSYLVDADGNLVTSTDSTNYGAYIVTNIDTHLGSVASPFPLRLIVHSDGTNAVLLQRVFHGLRQGTNLAVISTTQKALDPAHLDTARRITATHLPWTTDNAPMPFMGQFAQGGVLSTTATVEYGDQISNPFLHTYHPDHDNLDAFFKTELGQGAESYQITRSITLTITPGGDDFLSLTSAGKIIGGLYQEALTLGGQGGFTRTFNSSGAFVLTRISNIGTLTTH